MKRIGQRVRILGRLVEFIGKTGEIGGKEGNRYRVRLAEPSKLPASAASR